VTKYNWLLIFHLLGAFLFVSGSVVAGVLALTAMQREKPSEVALLLRLVRPVVVLVGVGSLIALGFGLWLVNEAGYTFGAGWIVAALVLWAASGALAGPAGTMLRHTRELAERRAQDGDRPSDELRLALRNRRALAMNTLAFALLVAILVLMVWKPGQ